MAKIECSIDTGEKTIDVKVDGKKVDNFGYLSAYSANSPYGYMFNMAAIEEMEDCSKTTYWSHSKEQTKEIEAFLSKLNSGKASEDSDEDDMPVDSDPKDKKKKKMMMTVKEKKKC